MITRSLDITIRTFDALRSAAELDTVAKLYEEIYAEPPYNEGPDEAAEFVDSWPSYLSQGAFRLVIAYTNDEPIGFAFGFQLPADTHWWSNDRFLDSLDDGISLEYEGRTFVIIELAVQLPRRGLGIGGALHAALLADRPEERVTLTVRPEAENVLKMYESWGYTQVGRMRPAPGKPTYVAMMRDPI